MAGWSVRRDEDYTILTHKDPDLRVDVYEDGLDMIDLYQTDNAMSFVVIKDLESWIKALQDLRRVLEDVIV